MKKSFISFLLNASILLSTFFSLTTFAGCHSHEALGWDYDDTRHWQYCSCEKTLNSKKHTYDDEGWCTVCNYSDTPTEGVKYSFSSDGTYAQVVGYTGTSARVRISDSYNGSPIKSIAKNAFSKSSIQTVFIPSSVTNIGDGAFSGCNNLSNVNIPHKVTTIGDSAFANCNSLQSITLPNSVTSIGYTAFEGCSNLTSITIPDGVISVSGDAFSGCDNLQFNVYKNINYLGNNNNPYAVLISTTDETLDTYTIHKDTKIIVSSAFQYYRNLSNIILPDGVTSIGDAAFRGCSSLTNITIPDSVTEIGYYAFDDCSSLTSITIPDSVTSIRDYSFSWCSNLQSITIPDSVTSIGDDAFSRCSSLTNITIPDGVTCIGDAAFRGCNSLTNITIPDSVNFISEDAFSGCDNLQFNIHKNINYLGNSNNPYFALISPTDKTLTTYEIHTDTKLIISRAFDSCSNLDSLTIPASVTSIGQYVFSGCKALSTLTFDDETTWFETSNLTDFINRTGGTRFYIGLETELDFKNGYVRGYLYKI